MKYDFTINTLRIHGLWKDQNREKTFKKLSIDFIDLDQKIESLYSKTISQLFNDFGEIGFREIERKILLKILDKKGTFILSLGGGTPCYFDNMEMIQKNRSFILHKFRFKSLS